MADPQPPDTTVYEDVLARWRSGRIRLFAILWTTYASLFLCRANLSAAKSTLETAVGLTKARQGYLDFLFKGAYAAGQWIGGALGDKFGGRVMIVVGVTGGAVMCCCFGFSKSFAAFALFWTVNGFLQSVVWPGVTKCFANWFPPRLRGKLHTVLCSSYLIGPAVTLVFTGYLLDHLPWQQAFIIPSGLLVIVALIAYAWASESPQKVGLPSLETLDQMYGSHKAGEVAEVEHTEEDQHDHHLGFRYTLKRTLANPRVWCLAGAFLCIDIVRHGAFDWLPRYFSDVDPNMRITSVAFRSWTVPLGGVLGSVAAGWCTDRFFGSRRVPLVCILLAWVALLLFIWARYSAALSDYGGAYLSLLGFFIFAPQVLIVGPLVMDLATRKAAGSASGIIGSIGYAGAAAMSAVTGQILDRFARAANPMGGWDLLFHIWAGAALLAALLLLPLWRFRPGEEKYF
ncbi:MAG TPA: MFS transporter [Armatimonadota bacterium]|nr:MFS transporter [Armatimonadota bacterium]